MTQAQTISVPDNAPAPAGGTPPEQILLTPAPAASAETGRRLCRSLQADPAQRYYLLVPRSAGPGAPMLLAVHGISRNAQQHIDCFRPFAEAFGIVLVAPLFDRERHPAYQRLGDATDGDRADRALDRIIAEVAQATGADGERVYLFGYSGGAQFAHRYAFANPDKVAAMALGAAGWYTFPDPKVRFPRGIKASKGPSEITLEPARFLHIPTLVLVGKADTRRDPSLNRTRSIDRQQGTNRVRRARRWVAAMSAAAAEHGLKTPVHLDYLPDAGHSFSEAAVDGDLVPRVLCFFFGAAGFRKMPSPASAT